MVCQFCCRLLKDFGAVSDRGFGSGSRDLTFREYAIDIKTWIVDNG